MSEVPKQIYVWNPWPLESQEARADEHLYISAAALRELVERWRAFYDEAVAQEMFKIGRHRWIECADDLEKLLEGE